MPELPDITIYIEALEARILDEAGNMVAAGSGGTRVGWLAAGERDAAAIKFPFVFRNLSKAKTFMITMEVEPKPGAATPAPSPAP